MFALLSFYTTVKITIDIVLFVIIFLLKVKFLSCDFQKIIRAFDPASYEQLAFRCYWRLHIKCCHRYSSEAVTVARWIPLQMFSV